MAIQKIGQDGRRIMHQRSCPSIVFWLLLSILSFCVPTHWVLVLGRRSAILHDNRYPLMCEFRGKWLQKYITIFNLGKLSYQGSREIPETNTYQSHIQNHIWGFHVQYSGTLAPLQYLIASYDMGNKTVHITNVDQSPNIQWWVFKIWNLCSWT